MPLHPDQEAMLRELKKKEFQLGIKFAVDGDRLNIISYDGTNKVSEKILAQARENGARFLREVFDLPESSPLMFVTSTDQAKTNVRVNATIKLDRLVTADVISKLNAPDIGRQ